MTGSHSCSDHYRFWMNQSSLTPVGEKLKMWVEQKYLSLLLRALDSAKPMNLYKLCEIGPGKGHFAMASIAAGFNYSAIESSPSLASELCGQGLRIGAGTFPEEDPFPDDRFDIIYLSHVLEHCDNRKEAVAFIRKCREKLLPGGLLFLNCPNVMSHGLYFWIADYTHNFVTAPIRIENMLADLGFVTLFSRKSIFGIYNHLGRFFLKCFFWVFRPGLLNKFQRFFKPRNQSGAEVYAFENFTIVARVSSREMSRKVE